MIHADSFTVDPNAWYHISVKWLYKWKCFVLNTPSPLVEMAPNHLVGVLPPGPIANEHDLFENGKIKGDLRINL